ncbi:MAG: DUF4434 domain-containing protein [Candidatus Hinthialibacter sp.]
MKRREFIKTLSISAGLNGAAFPTWAGGGKKESSVQPIGGSWFEFQHCWPYESEYWDAACAAFTCDQWRIKIREMAELGIQYLVLLSVAQDGKTFYPSKHFPRWNLNCEDPLEAVFSEADVQGSKIFVSSGFFDEKIGVLADAEGVKKRFQAMAELVECYGRHESFYGWYWPNEASLKPYFHDSFMTYCNQSSEEARKLTPQAKILIAPYGTRYTQNDAQFIRQLENLNVDIIAYQDEVGVRKTRVDQLEGIFSRLRKIHDQVPQISLWADMEIFSFQKEVYKSNLLPAPFPRIEGQLKSLSPYVDKILVYQYLGMMNKPGTPAHAGHSSSTRLYANYARWRRRLKQKAAAG